MEEVPPPLDVPPKIVPRPGMSLAARLLNVFAIPGQVFGELAAAPSALSNWLVPAICVALVGVLSALVLFSQPSIQKQFREHQQKVLEEGTKAGSITAEERALVDKLMSPVMLKTIGSAGAVVFGFSNVLWWGLVLWFLARSLLRVQIPFVKALEVAGLSAMINVLGSIVAMLLIVNIGRTGATPSLALLVKDFDATRKGHLFAAAANVFSIWVVGVRSIGLAKLTHTPYLRAAWAVFTFWLLEQSFLILSGISQWGM